MMTTVIRIIHMKLTKLTITQHIKITQRVSNNTIMATWVSQCHQKNLAFNTTNMPSQFLLY